MNSAAEVKVTKGRNFPDELQLGQLMRSTAGHAAVTRQHSQKLETTRRPVEWLALHCGSVNTEREVEERNSRPHGPLTALPKMEPNL